ncbi:MAG TPA: PBP1A family penicillin-binding protein [Blastocatellia bacterium]|nr:PBP1A family penicillin-binding protein [Blastocatellia bacterium]
MSIEATSKSKARRLLSMRTRVWRHSGAASGSHGNGLAVRVKSIGRRLLEPRVVFVLGLLAILTFATGLHFYSQLSREIDSRLRGGFLDNSVGIFTSPYKVSVGDRLGKDELLGYLHAAGYQQSDSEDQGPSGVYAINGDSIIIRPGRGAASQLNLRPVRVDLGRERVKAIKDPATGREIDSAEIEGELLASVRGGDRRKKVNVTFDEIPENLKNAVLAVEDRRFFNHLGVDWRGIARALYADLSEGQIVQGGSTITQQLIKNSFLSSDRTFTRKLKESAMAVILESRLSKEEIFSLYCNDVYLGQNGTFSVHGFAEAAQVYFDKNMSDLSLSESAFLAGLIHAPNRYSAQRDLSRAVERRNTVLDSMVAVGAIDPAAADTARRESLVIRKKKNESDYGTSYFIDYVQRFVEERYGDKGAINQQSVYTSMDPRLQKAAFDAVTAETARLDKVAGAGKRKGEEPRQVQAALVALDAHTGEVLAMIGGRSYDESQLNRATDARRQPGSTFKPFIYANALNMRSYTPATLLSDRPQEFGYDGGRRKYKPTNYGGGFSNRDVTLREALTRSLNVPTVDLALRVGLGNIAEMAEDCGLDRPPAYPSMALGTGEVTPLQLAGAYTAFANEGMALRPVPVKSVRGPARGGADGRAPAKSVRVFSPQIAYVMTTLMQSVVDSGTASRVRGMGLKGAIAGKTGTSNDGWFVGYTPNMVCVVWVGFDDNHDMKIKASDSALPIWATFMKEALEIRPALGGATFSKPGGIVTADIDPTTGFLASADCPEHREEVFIAGTQPIATCMHDISDDDYLASDMYDPELSLPGAEYEAVDYSRIALDICGDSGLLASSACSRVTRMKFEIGSEPREFCASDNHSRVRPEPPTDPGPSLLVEAGQRKKKRGPAEPPIPPESRSLRPPDER